MGPIKPADLALNDHPQQLVIDAWGCDDTPVRDLFAPIAEWARNAAPSFKDRYPKTWDEKRFIARLVREILLSVSLV